VLLVHGGYGQQALMHDEEVLGLIRKHFAAEKLLFSVCTGTLLCGAAGVLKGRRVTTHWSARHLMPDYGTVLKDARVTLVSLRTAAVPHYRLQIAKPTTNQGGMCNAPGG
jgi:cyclohexyl-isocyanide hydratase